MSDNCVISANNIWTQLCCNAS